MRWSVALIALCMSVAAIPAPAAVRHVPATYPRVGLALAAASPGDTVLVAAGTYAPSTNGETFPLQLPAGGVVLLGAGMDACVLDAQGTASVVRIDVPGAARVSGFRIRGGSAAQGGGIDILQGNVEVDHNSIDHNGAGIGGAGISVRNAAAPWIHHNLLLDNYATTSADVHAVRINQTVTGVFEHNLVAHTDGNGLLTVESAAPIVRHNIFYRNGIPSPLRGRGICWLSDPPATISHNLFFENQVAAVLWQGGGGDFSGPMANDFSPSDAVYGNLEADPLFVNAAAGDYHLVSSSPAIDAGDPTRPHDADGTVADIGPFAYPHMLTVPPGTGFRLALAAAPNPARDATEIRFTLPARGAANVDVLDAAGRAVRVLWRGDLEPGPHAIRWDGRDAAGQAAGPGVYFVRVRTGDGERAARVALIR
jgi:FlgD Ig-like domain/Right handed beta helix region